MKLKDRPMIWWIGRSFRYWCSADKNDTQKINYTVNHRSIGKGLEVYHFTTDDLIGVDKMYMLKTGIISELKHENNEWTVTVEAGIVPEELFKELKKKRNAILAE